MENTFKNKKDENISLFMIFDVYYCGTGKQPYELPYSKKGESRSDIILKQFRENVFLQNGKIYEN